MGGFFVDVLKANRASVFTQEANIPLFFVLRFSLTPHE